MEKENQLKPTINKILVSLVSSFGVPYLELVSFLGVVRIDCILSFLLQSHYFSWNQ